MEKAQRSLIFPNLEDIVALNRSHVKAYGGFYAEPDNLQNRNSLEWVLEAIQYPLFGEDRYPGIQQKSALLGWVIIAEHVFHDGNKRTGISAIKILLRWNDYYLQASHDELIDIALKIAFPKEDRLSDSDVANWIRARISSISF